MSMHTSSTISVDACYVDKVNTTSEFFQGTKMTEDILLTVHCTKTAVNLHSQPVNLHSKEKLQRILEILELDGGDLEVEKV